MAQTHKPQVDWSQLDDNILIRAHIRGDAAAFEVLFKKYRDLVSRLVYSIVRDETLVKDVIQEVFLLVYRHLHKFRQDAAFKTWVYRIAVNEALRQLSRLKRWQPLPEGETEPSAFASTLVVSEGMPSPERMLIEGEQRQHIHRALQGIKTQHRIILNLFYLEDLSIQEISTILEIPEGSVKSRLFYAREALKKVLEPLLQPEPMEKRGHHALQ